MPRPAPVPQILGATLVAVLLAVASPAAAEPTPSSPSTPSSSPTADSSTASATTTPTATPSATPSPLPSTSATTARTGQRRSLSRRAQRTVEIVEQAGGAKVRRHFRGLAEDDGQPFAIVFANCAAPGGETTADGSYSVLSEPGNPDFTWVVTGEAGVVDSGSGSLNEDDGGFTIENLTLGDFTLAITEEGLEPSGATTIFSVLGCVTTTVSCRAVTYTNPVGNPGVAVLYGRPTSSGFPDIDGALVDLSPGGSQTVRTARPATSWIGIALGDLEDDDEDDYNISLAGLVDSLAVPQDCDRPLSTLSVSCVDNHPRLTVTLAREGSNQPVELTVRNRKGKVVASGEPENDRSTVTLRLPGPGRYTYRSYFEGALAYETLPVEIDSCGVAAPAGNTLADTGPPPLLPLWFGSALLAAGAALLTRRTRPARRAAPHRRPPARGR